jgi:UDP-N-acetylmuramoylalanine--D-glutamate ligase
MTENWLHFDNFAVFGLGKSGIAAANLLADRGKQVVASDTAEPEELAPAVDKLDDDVDRVFGDNVWDGAEVVVVSPGMPPDLEVFQQVRADDIPIVSEIEIAYDASRAPVLAMTGTDGKTTTTSLLGRMAELSDRPSVVGGNIGTPLSSVVTDVPSDGLIVAEVSAFQLWSIHHFRPRVAGYTNIAGDHLDYFETREEYREAKRRLESNMRGDDLVVYNVDDPVLESWSESAPARCGLYGFDGVAGRGSDIEVREQGGVVFAEREAGRVELLDRRDFQLPGRHNVANAMCASAMALAADIAPSTITDALESFEPLPHRVEPCGTIDDVPFVNDSKATNVNAALAGLSSIETPYVAIVGGVDKGLELAPLCRHLAEHSSGVVVIGEVAGRFTDEMRAHVEESFRLQRADDLEEATRQAFRRARPESATVVLSPASSSFDMFDSYADRGETFRRIVGDLRAEHS